VASAFYIIRWAPPRVFPPPAGGEQCLRLLSVGDSFG
jgi:hypothetical protein